MFTFMRTRNGAAEVWQILLAENSRSDAVKRFGPSLIHEGTEVKPGEHPKFHEVGTLFVMHREQEADILLAAKAGLASDEERMLWFQVEALVGGHLHTQ